MPSAVIARFVEMLPDSVTSPELGSMVPVKSESATGLTPTVSGSGFVTITVNGSNVALACGKSSAPAPVTVPLLKCPVSGPIAPNAVVSVPVVICTETEPGFPTVAAAPVISNGTAIARTAPTARTAIHRRRTRPISEDPTRFMTVLLLPSPAHVSAGAH
jgi:hypothetical protein